MTTYPAPADPVSALTYPGGSEAHSTAHGRIIGVFENVKHYGAFGNSSATVTDPIGTDDTTAIQTAINAVAAAGGGTLYFPHGCYGITSGLTWLPGVRLMGDSGQNTLTRSTIKWHGANGGTMLTVSNTYTYDTALIDMTLEGKNATTRAANGIVFPNVADTGCRIVGCAIENFSTYGVDYQQGSINGHILHTRFDTIDQYAIHFTGSGDLNVSNSTGDLVGGGFILVDVSAVVYEGEVGGVKVNLKNLRVETNAALTNPHFHFKLNGADPVSRVQVVAVFDQANVYAGAAFHPITVPPPLKVEGDESAVLVLVATQLYGPITHPNYTDPGSVQFYQHFGEVIGPTNMELASFYRVGSNILGANSLKTSAAVHGSLPSPANYLAGAQYYCTTDKKPVWSDGSAHWVDAAGANHT